MSKKDGKLLRDIFFNKQSFEKVSRNTPLLLCVFVIPLAHGSAESVDQSTDGVCSSNLPVPFQGLSTPTEEYSKTNTKQCGFPYSTRSGIA